MTLYVFECQNCHFLLKHSLANPCGNIYVYDCPKCKKCNKFQFLREMDPQKDWYSHLVQIKNRRRRLGDGLRKTGKRAAPKKEEEAPAGGIN